VRRKVVVIGLDGATFDILQPWIEAGRLPTLRAMLEQGVSGRLRSVIPPVTTPAWSSFMTGKNPGKHGIFYFTAREKASGREVPVNATLVDGKTLWALLSEAGRTVVVLNVPCTYPPQPVNGVMVADFLTPKGRRDFTFPPSLVEELESRFGPYPLYLKTPIFSANLSEAHVEGFLQELHEELEYKFAVTHYLMDRYDPDFVMLHIWGTDRIQHELWDLMDTRHPRYKKALAGKYQERIIGYFRAVDGEIGRIQKRVDDETTIFVISDHGFGPIHKFIDLNVWLLEQGYIAIKGTPGARLRYLAWKLGLTYGFLIKLLQRTVLRWGFRLPDKAPVDGLRMAQEGSRQPLLSLNDIDWARTKAFCKLGLGQITINLEGRNPQGCVKPGREYEALRNELVEKLKDLRDPATGEKVGGEIFTKEEIYHGEHLDEAPDITFLPLENKYIAGSLLGFTMRRSVIDNPFMFGNHRMDGILVARGKPLARGKEIEGAGILDLAPTILYLMGQKIPTDMDGKVLVELFTKDFLASHPVEFAEPGEPAGPVSLTMSQEDEADIIDRLRGLGYL